jgi:hypothetical protein
MTPGGEPLSPTSCSSRDGHLGGAELTRYRIASVGQDCRLLLWDFTVEEADFRDNLDFSNPAYPFSFSY